MKRRTTPGIRRQPLRDDQTTRKRLLEAAGQVFADRGFHGATGKEICERAGTNAAAVNYHFGGIDNLYAAVVEEAHSRFVTLAAAEAALAGKADARAKLEAILELIVRVLTGPRSSWALRVLGREFVAPSPALDSLRVRELIPKTRILRAIVSEWTGLPETHPAVARGCISVMGPCFLMLLLDRRTLKRAFPHLGLSPKDAPSLTRHLLHFARAGLSEIANAARDMDDTV
jgi:AcrR family transcriptional regulator